MISRLAVAAALIWIAGAADAVRAEWSASQRTDFVKECATACRDNPKVGQSYKNRCPRYCDCYIDEAVRVAPDYDVLEREITREGPETELVRQFKAIAPACNTSVFGTRPNQR